MSRYIDGNLADMTLIIVTRETVPRDQLDGWNISALVENNPLNVTVMLPIPHVNGSEKLRHRDVGGISEPTFPPMLVQGSRDVVK